MIDFKALAGELQGQVPADAATQEEAAASLTAGGQKRTTINPADFGGKPVAPAAADATAAQFGGRPVDPIQIRKALDAVKNPSASAEQKFSILKTIGNIPGSAARTVEGLAGVVAHPIRTAKGIGAAAIGGIEKLIPGEQGQEQAFNQVADYYKQRYGSIDNLLKTVQDDPVGFGLDLSGVLTLGGAGLARAGGTLGRVGATAVRAGEVLDPFAAAVKAVGKGVGKVAAPFEESAAAAGVSKTVQAARRAGVELPLSATTNSKALRTAEAISQKGIFGQRIADMIDAANEAIRESVQKTIDFIGPEARHADFMQHAGEALVAGFDEMKNKFHETKTALYDAASEELAGVTASAKNLEAAARGVLAAKGESLLARGISGEVSSLLDNIKTHKESAAPPGQLALPVENVPGGPFTYEQLKETRSAIGEKLNSRDPVITTGDKAVYEQLYAAVSRDMDDALKAFSPDLRSKVVKANEFYGKGVNLLKSKVAKSMQAAIKEGKIGTVVDRLVKPGSVEMVRNYTKPLIGAENVPMLQAAFIRKMLDASMVNGSISGAKLSAFIDQYSLPVLRELLSKEQVSKILDARELALAIESGTKIARGSQTAFIAKLSAMGGIALVNPALLARLLLGDFLTSRLLTTRWGKKYLTTGSTTGKAVSKAIKDSAGKTHKAVIVGAQLRALQEKK